MDVPREVGSGSGHKGQPTGEGEQRRNWSPTASSPLMLHGGFSDCPLQGPGKVLNGCFNERMKVLKVFLFEYKELVVLVIDTVSYRFYNLDI